MIPQVPGTGSVCCASVQKDIVGDGTWVSVVLRVVSAATPIVEKLTLNSSSISIDF